MKRAEDQPHEESKKAEEEQASSEEAEESEVAEQSECPILSEVAEQSECPILYEDGGLNLLLQLERGSAIVDALNKSANGPLRSGVPHNYAIQSLIKSERSAIKN